MTGLHFRRFDENLAVEVTKHPPGPSLGAIGRGDAEVFKAGGLHTLLDPPLGLADKMFFLARRFPFPGCGNHPLVVIPAQEGIQRDFRSHGICIGSPQAF